jgi:hypothetical protein
LVDRDDLISGKFLEIIECDLDLAVGALSADRELVGRGIDVGDVGKMIADVESTFGVIGVLKYSSGAS